MSQCKIYAINKKTPLIVIENLIDLMQTIIKHHQN
jgi:hypothetical protein